MEADILKALKFELGGPTVKTFLRHVCFIDFILLVLNGLVVVPFFFPGMLAHCKLLCLQKIL